MKHTTNDGTEALATLEQETPFWYNRAMAVHRHWRQRRGCWRFCTAGSWLLAARGEKPLQTIQDWGALGEVIGGVAVLFTIVYLAVQLRRSTRATHRQTYHAAAESISRFSWNLAKDPDLHRLYRSALQSPDSLSGDELLRGFSVLDAYLSLMESFYLHNREFGEVHSQERWTRMLTRMFGMPGAARYWKERRWQFHTHFASYVDELSGQSSAP